MRSTHSSLSAAMTRTTTATSPPWTSWRLWRHSNLICSRHSSPRTYWLWVFNLWNLGVWRVQIIEVDFSRMKFRLDSESLQSLGCTSAGKSFQFFFIIRYNNIYGDIVLSINTQSNTIQMGRPFLQVSGSEQSPGAKKVSYPFFTAFISLLNNMELVKQIYTSLVKGNPSIEVTKGQFKGHWENTGQWCKSLPVSQLEMKMNEVQGHCERFNKLLAKWECLCRFFCVV